jgi:hypothetical protein
MERIIRRFLNVYEKDGNDLQTLAFVPMNLPNMLPLISYWPQENSG